MFIVGGPLFVSFCFYPASFAFSQSRSSRYAPSKSKPEINQRRFSEPVIPMLLSIFAISVELI